MVAVSEIDTFELGAAFLCSLPRDGRALRRSTNPEVQLLNSHSLNQAIPSRRILAMGDLVKRVGLSRRSVYEAMSHGDFPRPIQLTARRVGWLEDEVDAWIAAKIEARDRAMRGNCR